MSRQAHAAAGLTRPLAAFGFSFLACLFLLRMAGTSFVLGAGACFVLASAAALLLPGLRARAGYLRVILPAGACACAALLLHGLLVSGPVDTLSGGEHDVSARVEDVQPGYAEDLQNVTVRVLNMDDGAPGMPTGFRLRLNGTQGLALGDVVAVRLKFRSFADDGTRAYNYSKGFYIAASAKTTPRVAGQSVDFLCAMRALQYAAGENIVQKLPLRLSSVAAAMSIGDKRFLQDETLRAYRMAGLSHLLVVSGMHLSVLSGAVYLVFKKLLNRRAAAAVAGFAVVLLFSACTGFSPSIVRSGVGCILVLAGPLFGRRADVYTSLGLAAFLLCVQNPYAAGDAGLLLSFTSTIGAYEGAKLSRRFQTDGAKGVVPRARRMAGNIAAAATVSLCATAAMLPVLVWAGMGVSVLTVPVNLLAAPLVAPLMLIGFLMALPGAPAVNVLLAPFVTLEGAILVLLEKLTDFCAAHPALYIGVGGAFALAVVLAVYGLVYLAVRDKSNRRLYVGGAVSLAVLGAVMAFVLGLGTVRVSVAGNGSSSSLVVSRGRAAAVVYRGRLSANAVQDVFTRLNIRECPLFVDLRKTYQSTEYYSLFSPGEVVVARQDIAGRAVYNPLEDVDIYVVNQKDGSVACVDVDGYKIGIVTGHADVTGYAALDVLVAGSGEVTGDFDLLLVSGAPPDWVAGRDNVVVSSGNAQIVVRPGKGVVLREVRDGFVDG